MGGGLMQLVAYGA